MNTYQECVDYLNSLISYETKPNWSYDNKSLNLERFKEFLHRMGNSQNKLKIIHVAGSDGKGSTCAIISSVLQNMGYKTGLFTSPHLHSVRERIQVNRQWIPKDRFIYWTQYLKKELESHSPGSTGFTTFFELITAMMFLHFNDQNVDFAVVETGLGGRLDATNVGNPVLCIITHISMEHADKLGDTLEKISDEKLGIVRNEAPVIIAHQDEELLPHFHQSLRDISSFSFFVDKEYDLIESKVYEQKREISFKDSQQKTIALNSPLLGYYQTQNVLTAYASINVLAQQNMIENYTNNDFTSGLLQTAWNGRFEVIDHSPSKIVLDIAHTIKGAASLKQSLDEVFPKKHRIFILGFLQDKNYIELIQQLCRQDDQLYLTEAPTPRTVSLETLKQKCESLESQFNMHYIENCLDCFNSAVHRLNEDSILIVAGSLYLVSEIRNQLIPPIDE